MSLSDRERERERTWQFVAAVLIGVLATLLLSGIVGWVAVARNLVTRDELATVQADRQRDRETQALMAKVLAGLPSTEWYAQTTQQLSDLRSQMADLQDRFPRPPEPPEGS